MKSNTDLKNISIDKLAQDVVQSLKSKQKRVAFAESCTGGMVSAAITSVDGASEVLDLSMTTYANWAKVKYTDVTDEMLNAHGAVSSETALAMASGIRMTADSDIGIGITGIAGPGGGSESKPVGTVYIGIDCGNSQSVEHFVFEGGRNEVREQTTKMALMILKECAK